ncbi:uncharacterized protein EDB91DRAFT_1083117 [Suillus paluster]|uniref:uncharacterized protein n=1 Tax=Suillus paluster TaxID=48578 RepID=UPI001B8605F0|nr:uncharacterized protein EDB91DRAFT_1083117 [Suillus paluster]KAG1737078.1 hypothetical protein EDB91DRAFT_1083117 [Suillus paluster]
MSSKFPGSLGLRTPGAASYRTAKNSEPLRTPDAASASYRAANPALLRIPDAASYRAAHQTHLHALTPLLVPPTSIDSNHFLPFGPPTFILLDHPGNHRVQRQTTGAALAPLLPPRVGVSGTASCSSRSRAVSSGSSMRPSVPTTEFAPSFPKMTGHRNDTALVNSSQRATSHHTTGEWFQIFIGTASIRPFIIHLPPYWSFGGTQYGLSQVCQTVYYHSVVQPGTAIRPRPHSKTHRAVSWGGKAKENEDYSRFCPGPAVCADVQQWFPHAPHSKGDSVSGEKAQIPQKQLVRGLSPFKESSDQVRKQAAYAFMADPSLRRISTILAFGARYRYAEIARPLDEVLATLVETRYMTYGQCKGPILEDVPDWLQLSGQSDNSFELLDHEGLSARAFEITAQRIKRRERALWNL